MSDTNDLLKALKQSALDAVEASKPVHLVFGTVINTNPLEIQIEQKLTLNKEQLVLSRNVTNHKVSVSVSVSTDSKTISFDFSHAHSIDLTTDTKEDHSHTVKGDTSKTELKGSKSHSHTIDDTFDITVNNGLKKNEHVILGRIQGGQKYIVLDRIGG